MLSTCAKLLEWCWYSGVCSKQVPPTYSLSRLLPSHVYLSSNRHRQSAEIDVYTLEFRNWLRSCSQLVPNCCNDGGNLDCALHRYPTHIWSRKCCHRMRIGQGIVIEKELKMSLIHSGSRCDCFHVLNLCQPAAMMEVFSIILLTCTTHIFDLPTTGITCVFTKTQTLKKSSNCRVYTRARDFTAVKLWTCVKMLQCCR